MNRPVIPSTELRFLDEMGRRAFRAAAVVGAVGLIASVVIAMVIDDGASRFYHSYLVSFCYWLSLALGALFFVLLQHLTRSGWSVAVRRLGEALAATMPALAVLSLPVLAGMHDLYPWAQHEHVAGDPQLQGKQAYLNPAFFVVRVGLYFAVWVVLARYFFDKSVAQDSSGDVGLTLRMQRISAPGMVLFAVTVTFAAFDFLMSLDPHWYSTIFGVYYFSGGVVGFFALLAVTAGLVQRSGRLTRAITSEHYHDLGKLVFAFIVFWAYIAFSQYMLIWYGNIPEETIWYARRQTGGWTAVSLTLLFGHFFVPFFALLSRHPKRRTALLLIVAVWVLAMHWLDIYWLVMPGPNTERVPWHPLDLTCFVGIGGVFAATAVQRLRGRSLIPERDPRLLESLTFENV